jgi:hypothetical protein
MSKGFLANSELSCVGSIKAIDAIGPRDSVLKLRAIAMAGMIVVSCGTSMEEFGQLDRLFSNIFENADDVLIFTTP